MMIERFAGEDGKRRLIEAIEAQRIVGNDTTIAAAVVEHLALRELAGGEILIRQGDSDNDLFFILAGRLLVRVNGRIAAYRESGTHVGEIALIDPTAKRTADVEATEPTLVGVISESDFSILADAHPMLWRAFAIELGRRLDQRGRFFKPPNPVPVVFIGSSKETLPVAEAIREVLTVAELGTVLWTEGVFGASHFPIEDLERLLLGSDFAVLVAGADDLVVSRGASADAPRDNVVFELGLFMGALTRHRTFLAVPRGQELKIPSDLLGLTTLRWDLDAGPMADAVAGACEHVLDAVARLGPA